MSTSYWITPSKVLRVTRKHNKIIYPYKLNEVIIESTDCERDLGVLTSSTLTWSKQVDHLCNKATKMLGYDRRSTLDIKDATVRRRIHWCPVRSNLCYGSQIWAQQSVTSIKRVERLQRRAAKYILNVPFCCDTSYNQRLAPLDLLPLCYWREWPLIMTYYSLHPATKTRNQVVWSQSCDIDNYKTTTYQRYNTRRLPTKGHSSTEQKDYGTFY